MSGARYAPPNPAIRSPVRFPLPGERTKAPPVVNPLVISNEVRNLRTLVHAPRP